MCIGFIFKSSKCINNHSNRVRANKSKNMTNSALAGASYKKKREIGLVTCNRVEVLNSRLNSWKNRFVSISGRVVLINTVLWRVVFIVIMFRR